MKKYYYKVADISFMLMLPEGQDVDKLLPSFSPFVTEAVADPEFVLDASAKFELPSDAEALLSEENDAGYTEVHMYEEEFYISFSYGIKGHLMRVSRDYAKAWLNMVWEDEYAGMVLSSMLRALFAQVILMKNGVSLHASTVVSEDKAYMFMGSSGTGKSTHSRLWMEAFPGTQLLNDDNPAVRVMEDGVYAYGTPWSGKTPCYRNLKYPVCAIVKLAQAPSNRFERLHDIRAFVEVYKGCSFLRADVALHDMMCDTLSALVGMVQVAYLECLPDTSAAVLCKNSLIEQ